MSDSDSRYKIGEGDGVVIGIFGVFCNLGPEMGDDPQCLAFMTLEDPKPRIPVTVSCSHH